MPAQAAVSSAVTAGAISSPFGIAIALIVAGAVDAYLLGELLAPSSIGNDLGKQNLNIRSASESHKVVYGRTMVGGTVVFLDVLDRYYLQAVINTCPPQVQEKRKSGDYLNMAIAVAAHEIDAFEEIWVGDDKVFRSNPITGEMELRKDKYKGYIEFVAYNGNQSSADDFIRSNVDMHYGGKDATDATREAYYAPQGITDVTGGTSITIDPAQVYNSSDTLSYSEQDRDVDGNPIYCSGTFDGTYNFVKTGKNGRDTPSSGLPWTSSHILTNTAYVYLRFKFNPKLYKGIPKVRAVIRGKKIYDPRKDEINLPTLNDTGAWTVSTAYSINDKVTRGTRSYRCVTAHTSEDTTSTDDFIQDWLINEYWSQIHEIDNPVSWQWSDNWALCIRDYLTSGNYHDVLANVSYTRAINLYGIGVKNTEIDDDNVIEAANISDEIVYLRPSGLSIVSESYDNTKKRHTVVVSGDETLYYAPFENLEITSGGSIYITNFGTQSTKYNPTPAIGLPDIEEQLSRGNIYIESSVYDSGADQTTFKFRSAIDLSPTACRLYSRRFTINGVVDTSRSPLDILEDMLNCGSGNMPYAQGKFLLIPGVYITPTITIGDDNLAGSISVKGSLASSDLINTVSGTIKNAASKWEETDFPKQTSSLLIAEDGGYPLTQTVKYGFITSNFDAQRQARIALQRAREGVSCTMTCNLSVMEISTGAFINVTLDRLGWTNKVFSVTSWRYQENSIILGLREENSVAYDWDDTTLVPILYSPDTNFTVIPDLDPVTSLTAASGTNQLIQTLDGTLVPRVHITWTAPEQDFGTYLELVYRVYNPVTETSINRIAKIRDPEVEEFWILDVKEGYLINLDATIVLDDPNTRITGTTVSITEHTVVGKTQVPENVTGFTVSQNGIVVIFKWNPVGDIDLSGYEIRYAPRVGATWESATPLTEVTKGTNVTSADVAPGDWTFFIKAQDTSRLQSATATSKDLVVTTALNTIVQQNSSPDWGGTITGFAQHYTGALVPLSNSLASASGWDTFDVFVDDPITTVKTYESEEIDIDFDDTARVWGEVISALGPGEIGVADPLYEIDYRLDGDAYDGFEPWSVGELTLRYVKSKLTADTTNGVYYISQMITTVDQLEHSLNDTNVTIGASGTTITFSTPFHNPPFVRVFVEGSSALIATFELVTSVDFRVHVWNTSGTEVGGTISWDASGI